MRTQKNPPPNHNNVRARSTAPKVQHDRVLLIDVAKIQQKPMQNQGFWGASWLSLGSLGLSWASLELLGLHWGSLGLSWDSLGLSWGSLALPWGSLGAPLGFSWNFLSLSGSSLGVFWRFLGATWVSFQAFLDIDFAYEKPIFLNTTCILPMKNQYFLILCLEKAFAPSQHNPFMLRRS